MTNEVQSILNTSTDSVASANFIALHEKINANEERLNDINEQTKKKFQIIKENINQIRKKIEEERANSENYTQQKNNCIKSLEEKLADRFNEEQEIRQEIERKFNSLIDEKFISLKIEISKESRNRYQCIENLKTYLENDFPKLQGMVKIEQEERENNDMTLNKKILEEINRLQNDISENNAFYDIGVESEFNAVIYNSLYLHLVSKFSFASSKYINNIYCCANFLYFVVQLFRMSLCKFSYIY